MSRPRSPIKGTTPTIKVGMAANLGSSMFLFNGLESISPRLLGEATLQPVGRPPSRESIRSAPSYESHSDPKISPDAMTRSLSAKSTTGKRRSWFGSSPKSPSPPASDSFLLTLRCTTCARRRVSRPHHESCSTERDYNLSSSSGGRPAFLGHSSPNSLSSSAPSSPTGPRPKPKYSYPLEEERVLDLDLCDFANYACVERTKVVLRRHLGDPYMAAERGDAPLPPVDVGLLLEALTREGVKVGEPVVKEDY